VNVQMRVHILRTFITHLLSHIRQKKNIALEIAYMTISQAPFTSEIVGMILATDSCEYIILCRKSLVFFGCSSFLPQGKGGLG
jgi:hypothetical protein